MINQENKFKNTITSTDIHKYFFANKSSIKKNNVLFKQNSEASKIYFIISGTVRLSKIVNKQKILKLATSGDILGIESITDELQYSATATIIEDAEICIVSTKEINLIIKQHSYICCKLLIKLFKYHIDTEKIISVISFKIIEKNLNEIISEINLEKNTNQDFDIANNPLKKRNKIQTQKPAAHPAKPNYFQRKIKQIICL